MPRGFTAITAGGGGGRGGGLTFPGGIDGMSHEAFTSIVSPLSSLDGGGAGPRLLGGGGGGAPRLLGGGGGTGRGTLLRGRSSSESWSSHEGSTSIVLCPVRARVRGGGGFGGFDGFADFGATLFFEATTSV